MDDELLQDFLIEAGEILELLNEQLIDLEQRPDDMELLNAVFRGFHTIKGGAGFLTLDPMVVICHRSEDVFNMLRNEELKITPELMDVMLPVLDILNAQFECLKEAEEIPSAEQTLLDSLDAIIKGEPAAAPAAETSVVEDKAATPTSAESSADGDLDITDEEFESLLDALDNKKTEIDKPAVTAPVSGDISDDEFDNLMDELHGKGKFGQVDKGGDKEASKSEAEIKSAAPAEKPTGSDNITDDEFESLLDDIHGEGKFEVNKVSADDTKKPAEAKKPAAAKPAKKSVEPTPVENKKAESKTDKPADTKSKEKPVTQETTVRVDTKRLDDIMNMVGELVLVRNRIDRLGMLSGNEEMIKAVANLDLVTTDLQMAVMKTRMQPIKKVFGRFPRVVRDLARTMKKEIRLEMIGEETDLDKNLVEALADPMVHLVRNSVDHGVEMPDVREKAGKKRCGTIVLSAAQEGDHILLVIEDDGAGMDAQKLKNIAIEKGVLDKETASHMDDREAFNLIFAPGFSTKSEISDISGRGVGMDVVKTRISQLNGTIDIDSSLGKGTRISVKLPLTLAILPTLMVKLYPYRVSMKYFRSSPILLILWMVS